MKRLVVLVVLLCSVSAVAQATPVYDVNVDASVRATVLFVGDSNITYGAEQITDVLATRSDGYVPIFASRVGTGIRGFGHNTCAGCAASDYWAIHLAQTLANVTPDAVVIDLGINDATTAGTATTLGYSSYAQKIDWLLGQLPDVPVLWSTLPCTLEAPTYVAGCKVINAAIIDAATRHPNLTLVRWYVASTGHPEYMGTKPHYTDAGYTAWSKLVLQALGPLFPAA